MFRWISLFGVRYHQSKARRPKKTVKLRVEGLEDRTMPSASVPNPLAFEAVASPPPAPSIAAVATYLASTMDQWTQFITTVQQDVLAAWRMLGQEIAQEVSVIQQRWDRLVGINPNAPNPSLNSTVPQPGSDSGTGRGNSSGSGSGSSASTTHDSPNQPLNNSPQQSGSGSGSGSSSTTTHPIHPTQGGMVHPLTSGSGSGSGIAGSGTGSEGNGTGSGYATVSGNVWLDNNGDGSLDNNELGYQGITVDLFETDTTPWSLVQSTTTDSSGNYSFTPMLVGPYAYPYLVHVEFTNALGATFPGFNQINNKGNSAPFLLRAGGWRFIEAGLLSMTVTTTQDDPNAPIQNQITLRDAIQTGNNGGGPFGLNNITFYDFQEKEPLSGTIALQKALDPIKRSYDISGPGSSTLTIQGGGANNPFPIFTVNEGVNSTISGLTITGGYVKAQNGGGISNAGTLTLSGDNVNKNTAVATSSGDGRPVGGLGGGIYNNSDGNLTLSGTDVIGNTAAGGGGIANSGTLTTTAGIASLIADNIAVEGAGIANVGNLASAKILNATTIKGNFATGKGGGVFNSLGAATISGSSRTSEEIYTNRAASGGGIYVNSGTLTLRAFGNNENPHENQRFFASEHRRKCLFPLGKTRLIVN